MNYHYWSHSVITLLFVVIILTASPPKPLSLVKKWNAWTFQQFTIENSPKIQEEEEATSDSRRFPRSLFICEKTLLLIYTFDGSFNQAFVGQ